MIKLTETREITSYLWVRRGAVRARGQTRKMRQRASSRTTAVGRPQLTPGIHRTRSHDYAWYTCRSRCWSEFIKNFGIGLLRLGLREARHEIGRVQDHPEKEPRRTACVQSVRRRSFKFGVTSP
jgi:hypothetical protein